MELIPYDQESIIIEYETVWFLLNGEDLGRNGFSSADYGIEVWYNENNDGLWAAMPHVPVYREDGVSCPMLSSRITGTSSAQVINIAHDIARWLLENDSEGKLRTFEVINMPIDIEYERI